MINRNLLQCSHTNPSLSDHAAINRNFDFNNTPLAPPGTNVLVHKSSSTRTSFSKHTFAGWYIVPSLRHYQCYHCYTPSTASNRHADTVEFFPKHFDFHKITNSTYLGQAAEDIISIFSDQKDISSHPSLSFGTPVHNAYLQVARILRRSVQTPPTPPPHITPNIDKLPSSLPRLPTPSLPRVKTLPLLSVTTSTPHRYYTRQNRHQ